MWGYLGFSRYLITPPFNCFILNSLPKSKIETVVNPLTGKVKETTTKKSKHFPQLVCTGRVKGVRVSPSFLRYSLLSFPTEFTLRKRTTTDVVPLPLRPSPHVRNEVGPDTQSCRLHPTTFRPSRTWGPTNPLRGLEVRTTGPGPDSPRVRIPDGASSGPDGRTVRQEEGVHLT